jgi:hypothetical protein
MLSELAPDPLLPELVLLVIDCVLIERPRVSKTLVVKLSQSAVSLCSLLLQLVNVLLVVGHPDITNQVGNISMPIHPVSLLLQHVPQILLFLCLVTSDNLALGG